uniref:NADH-ubiquinone oxidoreductase chain 4L n=1 Tax=Kisaura zhejiangensis (nom. nud.) TaxID=2904921 RepID=A0A9E8LNY7_9NEOP|nr:NADH dehydrogenase subunit 4L [Kisaura zhejiangensis (nom. nud.)]UZZ44074.1 NADH dehydrogenase subunit 4L [Kisaura zhejiangensis (nom. nud.)]
MMMKILFLSMYIVGSLSFLLVRKHLLMLLLSLELIMLSLFLMLLMILFNMISEFYFLMIFMIFMVCESVLGLSILVSLVRIYGNDYFQSFNLMGC